MKNSQITAEKLGRALLAAFVIATPLVLSTARVEGFEDIKLAIQTLTALALIVLACSGRLRFGGLRQPLTLGVIFFLISAVVSTLFSVSSRTSWRGAYESHGGLLTIAGYAILFFAVRHFAPGRRLLLGVVIAAAIASIYALLQAAHLDPITWDGAASLGAQPRPFATMGHANLLGAYLAMSLPLIAYLGLRFAQRRRWLSVAGLSAVAVVVFAALVLTLSQSAWLATACAMVLLAIGWFCSRDRRAAVVVVGLLLVTTSTVGLAYQFNGLPQSLQTALTNRIQHVNDGIGRRDIWRAAWEIYGEHPVAGCGLDTFRLAFGTKRTPALWDLENEGTPIKAHNETLHILATQGTLGGIALLTLLVGLGWATVQAWRRTQDRALIAAVAASIIAFLVTSLFGYMVIATGSLFVLCAGMLSRWSESADPEEAVVVEPAKWRRWAIYGQAAGALVFAYIFVIEPLEANCNCHNGDLEMAADAAKALPFYQSAIEIDPNCDLYWLRLADAYQLQARRDGDLENLRQARTALEHAVALVPSDAYHHAALGRLLVELARTDKSVADSANAEWRTAAALDPNNPFILAEAARTALVVADYDLALQYAERGHELYPTWAVFRAQIAGAALARGHVPEAAEQLEQALAADWRNDVEGHGRALMMYAVAQIRLKDYVKAQEYAGMACVLLPKWPTPHYLRVEALNALGDRQEATKEFLIAQKLAGQPMGPAQ